MRIHGEKRAERLYSGASTTGFNERERYANVGIDQGRSQSGGCSSFTTLSPKPKCCQ